MENYIVSARKYRPSTFASVVGQKALTSTLKNAIATDRLAHAYLFCGSRGVGKTSCARIFAKTINCEHRTPDGDPCNECDSCRAFNENRSLNIIELDAASNNSVDDIRNLVDQVQVPPVNGKYRVFIVDEVHMLSSAAFNAFLKTLEEPPSYVVFILATTEKQKIIPTILSRCQIYDFNRITVKDMVDHLEYVASNEGFTTERAALNIIARKADGAMRDALSIFDQVAASSRGNVTYASTIDNLNVLDSAYYNRLLEAFIATNVPEALLIYKEIRDKGFDSHFFVTGLAAHLRDLMVARNPQTLEMLDTDEDVKQKMAEMAARVPIDFFYKAMSLCNDADLEYRQATSKTFLVELLLIKLCQLLSPSPIFSGDGEGQLKPFAAPSQGAIPAQAAQPAAPQAQTAAPTPQVAPQQEPQPASQRASQTAPQPATYRPVPTLRPSAPTINQGTPARGKMLASTHRVAPAQTEEQQPVEVTPATMRNGYYTDEQVDTAWSSFAAARTTEHVLVNSMRACRPQRKVDDLYEVLVQNEIQMSDFEALKGELLLHLRNALNNDHFDLTFALDNSGPAPRLWNDREVLQHLMEDPTTAKFITDLNLKLL